MKEFLDKHKYTLNVYAIYFIVIYAVITILYFAIPSILNYLPEVINTKFDIQMSTISYNLQILLIGLGISLISFIFLHFVLKNILKFERVKFKNDEWKKDIKFVEKIRLECYKIPYKIFIAQCPLGLLITVIILLSTGSHDAAMITKIFLLILSFDVLASVITFIFTRQIFVKLLLELPYDDNAKECTGSLNIQMKIMILPLILIALFFTVLVAYSRITVEKSNILFSSYDMQLSNIFNDKNSYSINEIKDRLNEVSKIEKNNNRVIILNNKDYISLDNRKVSDFILEYTTQIAQKYEGKVMDSYGQDIQGIMKKIYCEEYNKYVYVGIIYDLNANSALLFLMISSIIFFILNWIVVRYIVWDLTSNISSVLERLKNISDTEYSMDKKIGKLKITSNDEIGELVRVFNNIQQLENNYIDEIQENQETLKEQDRLASLGQLIGGIAHNLKTPIMSIAGNLQGLQDLTNEYDLSIGDAEVTNEDHKQIAGEMNELISKTKVHLTYMSDVISAVKGQASQLDSSEDQVFDAIEIVKKVDLFMKHELKNALVELKTNISDDVKMKCIKGDSNSLVQVLNNLIQNSIYASVKKKSTVIDFNVYLTEKGICFEIKDYGTGMPESIQEKLFKEMITTKGKNGTGLGLYMSYSTIKGKFKGTMEFESKQDVGTTFYVTIPVME